METTSVSAAPDLVKGIEYCRHCACSDLVSVLDLGIHAVSDFYSKVPENELKAPLHLVECAQCHLVQLTHSVSRERLYQDYWYRSGTNETMIEALHDVVRDVKSLVDLSYGDTVLDIGANDGTLFDQYDVGVHRRGYEPSQLWHEANNRGIVINGFYPQDRVSYFKKAKAITSIAMFYDLDEPHAFVEAIKEDLTPDGIWLNQMMDLQGMLLVNAFDNICHEHVAYWSKEGFENLLNEHDLEISKISYNTVNGGSLRTIARHALQDAHFPHMTEPKGYRFSAFRRNVERAKNECLEFLYKMRADDRLVLGYGASTKGNTLLQYYGIATYLLPAIAERNPDKIGKMTAGTHIPIISEDEMRARKPDYLLVLPWHFIHAFEQRERGLMESGTRFVVPLPEFRVI